jgi:hypothetical protein
MKHQHNSNGREWLMVEVPSEAVGIEINEYYKRLTYRMPPITEPHHPFAQIDLPSGTWRIHSDSLTITEEQAGEIVEKGHNGEGYKCYDPIVTHIVEGYPLTYFDGSPYIYATDSYRSLLRSKNINSRVINLVSK